MALPGFQQMGSLFRLAPAVPSSVETVTAERRAATRQPGEGNAILRWESDFQSRELPVEVLDCSTAGVGIAVSERLPVGLVAQIRWDGTTSQLAVVRHCTRVNGRFVAGVMYLASERRAEERAAIYERGDLTWDDPVEGRISTAVELQDLSTGGMRFQTGSQVPVPLLVCLKAGGWRYYGTTRHCEPADGGYSIGIQILYTEVIDPNALSHF